MTYDSQDGNEFHVRKHDGSVRVFQESDHGLYFMDTDTTPEGTILVNTVADNRSKYNNRDYSGAAVARQLQQIIGRPSTRTYLYIIAENLLSNCPCQDKTF